jgi:DNA-binding CsgD family transcriptional regulator/PAS domain-containing protein
VSLDPPSGASGGALLRLLDPLYEGAVHSVGWQAFVAELARELGADIVVLEGGRASAGRITHPRDFDLRGAAPAGMGRRHALGPMALDVAGERWHLQAFRERGKPPFGTGEARLFKGLRDHLRRAAEIRARASGVDRTPHWLARAIDGLTTGVVLLGNRGQVVFANQEGERILGRRDGLRLTECGLRAVDPSADRELRRCVAAAQRRASSGRLAIPRPTSSNTPYIVRIVSLPSDPFSVGRLAGVFVVDPDRRSPVEAEDLIATFALSPSQARVAARLCQGETLKEAAAAEGIAFETARVHLKGVFRKTKTHRQPELIGLLLDALPSVQLQGPLASPGPEHP